MWRGAGGCASLASATAHHRPGKVEGAHRRRGHKHVVQATGSRRCAMAWVKKVDLLGGVLGELVEGDDHRQAVGL